MKVVQFAHLYIAFCKLYLIQGFGLIPTDTDQHIHSPSLVPEYDMILSKQNRTTTRALKVLSGHLPLELMPLWCISELLSCHILLFFYSSLCEFAFSCIKTVDDPSLLNNKWSCPSWCHARGGTITTHLAKYRYHLRGSAFSHEESFQRDSPPNHRVIFNGHHPSCWTIIQPY